MLYIQDGNESVVRAHFDEAAERWYADRPERELFLVFLALPSQEARMEEYTMGTAGARGDDYARFVRESVVPAVDAAFRTRADRAARGLVGASLGGCWTSSTASLPRERRRIASAQRCATRPATAIQSRHSPSMRPIP